MSKIFTKVIVHTVNDLTNHYWLSEIVIWLIFKKIIKCITLLISYCLSLQLECIFPRHRYQSWCHRRLPNLNIPYFEWHWMHVQLRHICQPQTWSHQDSQALCILDSHLPFGAAPPGFQPGLAAWRNSVSSLPPTFPFTVCKPWPSARGMVLVALTAEYQECLKAGTVTVQQGEGVLTHFVDIYHLFTSTEKMHGMFQFHNFSLTW